MWGVGGNSGQEQKNTCLNVGLIFDLLAGQ
jgi:hypothetical protein